MPSTLNFDDVGSAYNKSTNASQSGYGGMFTESGSGCNGIATISPTTSSSMFTVTPVAAGGPCTFTITGGNGKSASLTINVTTSTGTIMAKPHNAPSPRPGSPPKR